MNTEYHFWVGVNSGYIWAMSRNYKTCPKGGERLKYLGYTEEIGGGWPKKLSTGRLLHKPSPTSKSKQRKKEVVRVAHKTDTVSNNTKHHLDSALNGVVTENYDSKGQRRRLNFRLS